VKPASPESTFFIIHTCDLHNRLTDAGGQVIENLRRQHPGCLLLDSGDAVGAGNLTYRVRGEPILRLMGSLGYQAMTMGNRESHPKAAILARKLRDASFPILAANLRPQRGKSLPSKVRSHIEVEVAAAGRSGARSVGVCVIGLAPQMTKPGSWWSRATDFVFDDPLECAAGLVRKLRETNDVIILLTHLGLEADRALANLEGVHLILGGHDHKPLFPPSKMGSAYVAHAEPFARSAGLVEVHVHEGGGISATGHLVSLKETSG
jgi:5'-nucleotidase